MKTFGTLSYDKKKNSWVVQCEPHVSMKLKQVFGKIYKGQFGKISISATDENSKDLEWFMQRYPLVVEESAAPVLDQKARAFDQIADDTYQILRDGYEPPSFSNMALPPRRYQSVAAALGHKVRGLLVADELGLGKLNPVDTNVLTPTGWRKIGDLCVGDLVIGSAGLPIRVTGVFPQGVKASYRVWFGDGSSVEAGDEHLWTVRHLVGGRRWGELVVTTGQIRRGETIIREWPNGRITGLNLGRTGLYLPMLSGPVQFERKSDLPVSPYTLGALIANGGLTNGNATLTVGTPDWDEISSSVFAEKNVFGNVRVSNDSGTVTTSNILDTIGKIRELGLCVPSAKKFIPDIYLRASVDDRIALLHGLMDCDGSCSKERNRVCYHTISERLACDVRELVECLGGSATIREYDRSKESKPTEYQVRIHLPSTIRPFKLRRKDERYHPRVRKEPTRRFREIEYVRDVESVCISVDAEDQLYVTEHAILTHNTITAITMLSMPKTLPALVVCPTHLPGQWERELHRFLPGIRTHITKKSKPYGLDTPDVIITNYHKLSGWAAHLASYINTVIFDEVQELRRDGSNGIRSQKYAAAEHLSHSVDYRLGLSATPIYNYGAEFYNVFNCLAPGMLGEKPEFLREWCTGYYEERKARINDPKAFGTYLRESGRMLLRTKKEVGRELPSLNKVVQEVESDISHLKKVEDSATELASFIVNASGVKGFDMMKASQEFSNKLRQATGLAKAPYVAEFVRMLAETTDEKILLFGWHRECYNIWAARLFNLFPAWYTGSESPAKKQKELDKFLKDDKCRVMMMSLRAGSGVDGLQNVCSRAVIGELDWSPGAIEQCIGRVHRDGQPHPVFAYYLTALDGADPVMVDVLGLKRAQLEGVKDPEGKLVVKSQVDPDHVKKLAAKYLEKKK